jgi:hypothetical protein
MGHTEFSVAQQARGFVSKVNPTTIPVPMDPYLKEVQAVLRVEKDMEPNEAGIPWHWGTSAVLKNTVLLPLISAVRRQRSGWYSLPPRNTQGLPSLGMRQSHRRHRL